MTEKETQATRFINYVFSRLAEDTAMGARLRRADNPATEEQAWRYFARFGVNLEDARSVKAYATVAAALARAKPQKDGEHSLGRSLAGISGVRSADEQDGPAAVRLRRILSCRTTEEACEVLRPLLRLIAAQSSHSLCYTALLHDLLYFNDATRRRWANAFYSFSPLESQEERDTP